jgi:signal transduction histidine kinase
LEQRRDALLIFKEALNNIRRHAGARKASIRVADSEGQFMMQISDDGSGFDPSATHTGHGLDSQRRRAGRLGGELQIDTAPGRGTRLTLRVKFESSSPSNQHST